MTRFLAVLQTGLAAILFFIAAATLINMVLIAMRPETISVVNTIIGQTVMIVCLVALGRILWRKGIVQLKSESPGLPESVRQDDNDA
jgi:hypothetical protein